MIVKPFLAFFELQACHIREMTQWCSKELSLIDKIGNSLKLIVDSGHFTVHLSQDVGQLSIDYECERDEAICSVPIKLFKVGDFKYYMQMLGRDGMSGSWCVWCMAHPSYWRSYFTEPNSIPQEEKELRKGIVGNVIWEFIQPNHYIFPVLHFEISAINNVLGSFYGFVEDRVELLSQEETVL